MKDLRKIAQQQTSLSKLMEGREKITMKMLVINHPNGVTVTSVDVVPDTKTGEMYSIFTFSENEKLFASGGIVFNKVVNAWLAEYDNDIEMLNHDLAEMGGVKVKFAYGKTGNNRDIVKCEIL